MRQNNKSRLTSIKNTHRKKLSNLGIASKNNLDRERVVINLSKRNLTVSEKEVLSFGLSFALPKLKINYVQHYFKFEKLLASLKRLSCNSFNDVIREVSSIAHSSFNDFSSYKTSFPTLPKHLFESLKALRSDPSIIITSPDKGRGCVILDKLDYINKVETILNDHTKFKLITQEPFKFMTKLEDKLARLLRKFLRLNLITKDLFNYLFPSGSTLGVLYGLPKIHKANIPIRPILSTIGTFNYNLAKFFVPIIEPLTVNSYTLKKSYEFV